MEPWWILILVAAVVGSVLLLWGPARMAAREARLTRARKNFHRQRERLEARLIRLATAHCQAESPRWADCQFDDDVLYVRHRATGELSAFVGVTVAMEAVDGLPSSARSSLARHPDGTAVFRFDGKQWQTDGRVILNRSPSEAIRSCQSDLEIVGQEVAQRSL
jgi:hypothetical protein